MYQVPVLKTHPHGPVELEKHNERCRVGAYYRLVIIKGYYLTDSVSLRRLPEPFDSKPVQQKKQTCRCFSHKVKPCYTKPICRPNFLFFGSRKAYDNGKPFKTGILYEPIGQNRRFGHIWLQWNPSTVCVCESV